MESRQQMPSVIARLMGIDELSSQQTDQKQQRVLSGKYLQRVASLGIRENSQSYKYLCRKVSDAGKELKEVELAGTLQRGNFYNQWDVKGKAKFGLTELNAEFRGPTSTDSKCSSKDERHLRKPGNVMKSPISYGYRTLKIHREYNDTSTKNLHTPSHLQARKNTISKSTSPFYCKSNSVCRKAGEITEQAKLPQFSRCRLYSKEQVHLSRTGILNGGIKLSNPSHNLDADWKDKYFGVPRHRPLPAYFLTLQSQRTGRNKTFNNKRREQHREYARKVPPGSEMQDRIRKKCLDRSRLSSSSDKNSRPFTHIDTKDNHPSFGKYWTVDGQSKADHSEDICWKSLVASPSLNKSLDFMKDDDSFSQSGDGSRQQDTSIWYSEDGSSLSQYSGTDRESFTSLEGYQPSPDSVLERYNRDDRHRTRSECLWGVSEADPHGVKMQLELLKSDSFEGYSEGSEVNVSSDEDDGGESICCSQENKNAIGVFRIEKSRDFSYLVDVLNEAGFLDRTPGQGYKEWHMEDCRTSLHIFETLEKKYGEQTCWQRSERRLLFDRINIGLLEIVMPCMGVPSWTKPVSKRLPVQRKEAIEDELWSLLVKEESESCNITSNKSVADFDGWLNLGDHVEMIVVELEKMLVDELAAEVVSI